MAIQEKIVVLYLADGKYQISYGVTVMDAIMRAKLAIRQVRRYTWEGEPTYMWVDKNWIIRDNLEIRTAIDLYRQTLTNASDVVKAAIVGEMTPEVAASAAKASAIAEAAEVTKLTTPTSTVDEDAVAAEKSEE